ncbi:HlyD family efflux transporter periplasmic adaptor subunit [Plantibacter sp. CFBP 8798]|uniref:efflux RND transporter periplasmic adaptor subunit n=2 Tax=unclassified Plantibacter TaxID=2624265 RepID=UPI00177B41F5|nr:HlyD family efflux transporter periplasmic adaptor subunit [Plantibacter sp. CFBP 8798]MBD8467267.1 HlyD family efflux transporter periplasmic adaptor subunit [Plantibacter sp. CFBP 8798]
MRKKRMVIVVLGASAIAIAAASVFALGGSFSSPPAPTSTVKVTRGDVTSTVSGKGAISAAQTSNASFARPGTISSISVTLGQAVAVGQDLAAVDPADADRALEKAQEALSAADTAVVNARSSYASAKQNLTDARDTLNAIAPDAPEYASAVSSVRSQEESLPGRDTDVVNAVKARDDAAREIAAAQAARDQTVLKAPIAGVVTAINGTVGSVTSGGGTSSEAPAADAAKPAASTALITISDTSTLRVTALIPEADIGRVALEQIASVTLAGGPSEAPTSGTIVAVAPTPQTSTDGVVSYPVTIQLSNPPATVKLGQTGFVAIVTASRTAVLTLPAAAINQSVPGKTTVMRVPAGKNAAPRSVPVTIGLSGNGIIEILDGLEPGDIIELPAAGSAGKAPMGSAQ